jgi:hypothetical protein
VKQSTSKTAAALAASIVLVAVTAVLTMAAVLRPRVLGFHDSTRAAPARAATPVAGVAGGAPGPASSDHGTTEPAPTPGPLETAPPSTGSAPEAPAAPVTIAPPSPAPTTSPSIATTRPSPPSGCREPEWDPERGTWHCSNDDEDEEEDD